MARHVSTPELRAHQWRRKKEEEQKATRERQEVRVKYDIKAIQSILRGLGVKTATKQAGMVWGSPNYSEGYWIILHMDGPSIYFYHVGLNTIRALISAMHEEGIEVERFYEGNQSGKGIDPYISLKERK